AWRNLESVNPVAPSAPIVRKLRRLMRVCRKSAQQTGGWVIECLWFGRRRGSGGPTKDRGGGGGGGTISFLFFRPLRGGGNQKLRKRQANRCVGVRTKEVWRSAAEKCYNPQGKLFSDQSDGNLGEGITMNPLQSLIASGTKLWLDSIDPDLISRNRALGATG